MAKVKKFKHWLKEERLKRFLKQTELAEKLGVFYYTIHNLESGKSKPSLNTIKKICEFFDISYEQINEMLEVQ